MPIQLLFVDGCSHQQVAGELLRLALAAVGRSDDVEAVLVRTPEEAQEWGFHGSRSVLLDGHDPFAASDAPIGLACRIYRTRHISASKRLALSGREC